MPFPFVERDRMQARPALLVSGQIGPEQSLVWSLMITSARRGSWPGDISLVEDHSEFGLPRPCVIRTEKIAVLPVRSIERRIGHLSPRLLAEVSGRLRAHLGL